MGIDAEIFFKRVNETELEKGAHYWHPPGATHRDHRWDGRYWCPTYRRGHWPSIAAVLLDLLTDPMVERVWYFGDDCSDNLEPFTKLDFIAYMAAYLQEY